MVKRVERIGLGEGAWFISCRLRHNVMSSIALQLCLHFGPSGEVEPYGCVTVPRFAGT